MTPIKPESPVKRETSATERGRPIVIGLHPKYLTLRVKGQRRAFQLTYDQLMWKCYHMAAEQLRQERRRCS